MIARNEIVNRIIIVLVILSFFFVTCKKEPIENRTRGQWKIEKVFLNGYDKTKELDTLLIDYYDFGGWIDGKRENEYPPELNIKVDKNATWTDSLCSDLSLPYDISDDGVEFHVQSLSVSCNIQSIVPCFIIIHGEESWKIVKWNSSEFWVEMNYNGNIYETHFKKM